MTKNTHTVRIGDLDLTGTTKEIAIVLRQEPYFLSMGKIADLIGQTRSNIHRVLKDTPYAGRLSNTVPVLDKSIFQTLRDEEIVTKFNVPLTHVIDERRKLSIRTPTKINIKRRQTMLCEIIFGDEFSPGVSFREIIQLLVDSLLKTTLQRGLIMNFYFEGAVSSNSDKVYRHELRQQIKIYVGKVMKTGDMQKILNKGGVIKKDAEVLV